jgi:WD40-like Beta Propeller Repeat
LYAQRLQDRTAQEIDTGQGPAVLPQASPDGKWILYVATPKGGPHRLFRIPVSGGIPEEVAIGGPVDENRCPLHGPSCVLRETEGQKTFAYYALDPVKGKGRLLARTAWFPNVLSDWSVAPDGSAVALAIHDAAIREYASSRFKRVPPDANTGFQSGATAGLQGSPGRQTEKDGMLRPIRNWVRSCSTSI